ncbi:MAG: PorT family protein [Cyclobacteriaceae bacterium]|nr:PorT family protein [Cyclobacteriaceae bacterium]
MRKIKLLFAFAFFIGSTSLSAQIFWGPKGSIQGYKTVFDDITVKDTLDSKFRLGFTIGGFVNVPLKKEYSLVAELSYVRRGRKNIIQSDQGRLTHISKYNFLELPMMIRRQFKVNLKENMESAWYLEIGPNISYWMGGKGEFKDVAEPFSYKLKFESADATTDDVMFLTNSNRFLFGLEVGAGINLQTRLREFVGIELRYTHGQTFLGKKDSEVVLSNSFIQFTDNFIANYRVASLNISYNFMLDVREFKKGASVSDKKKKVKRKKQKR